MKKFDVHTHFDYENAIVNGCLSDAVLVDGLSSLGIHPWFVPDDWEEILTGFRVKMNHDSKILAIGECGLDKMKGAPWENQLSVFKAQICLAEELKLPLIIHCVRSYNECETLLKDVDVPVVFHGFNRNIHVMSQLLQRDNFYFSFGKAIFQESLNETIKKCPIERLFLETDDDNIDIELIYRKLSSIKKTPLEGVENQILLNRRKVFGV